MFLRDAAERTKMAQIAQFHGLEMLVSQGGFIKDVIESEITELFPEIVMEKVLKYHEIGPGFWEVAEATEQAYFRMEEYIELELGLEGVPVLIEQEAFCDWYIEQCARLASEGAKNGTERFWLKWNLSRKTKNALEKLTVLEERIFFLMQGLDGSENCTLSKVAAMPEFQCDKKYISYVWEQLEEKLFLNDCSSDELYHECEVYRQNESQKDTREND